jgi:hypothetical protein
MKTLGYSVRAGPRSADRHRTVGFAVASEYVTQSDDRGSHVVGAKLTKTCNVDTCADGVDRQNPAIDVLQQRNKGAGRAEMPKLPTKERARCARCHENRHPVTGNDRFRQKGKDFALGPKASNRCHAIVAGTIGERSSLVVGADVSGWAIRGIQREWSRCCNALKLWSQQSRINLAISQSSDVGGIW